MVTMSMIAHAFPSRATGISVQVCSIGWLTGNSRFTTTGGICAVIYLFVDGSYVGEAYCPAFMGQRISEWEAKVMRSADAARARATASASAEVRAGIQEEIATTKKQRRQALRKQEKARQFDRQREEIHPSSVLETLKTFAPPERKSLQVPKARPDSGRAPGGQILPIRYRSTEVDR